MISLVKINLFFLNPAFQFMMVTSCLLDTIMMKPYLCTVTICTFWLDILLYKSIPSEHTGILLAYSFALWDLLPSLTFTNKGDKSRGTSCSLFNTCNSAFLLKIFCRKMCKFSGQKFPRCLSQAAL